MKKWLWAPILVILIFLFCCQKQEKAEQTDLGTESEVMGIAVIAQTIGNNLDLAVASLEKGQLGEGTGLLLDSVLLVKPQDSWPEGFVKYVSSAKEQFAAGIFADAVGNVTEALHLVKQSSDIEQPTESENIAPLAEIVKWKISEAKEAFQKGNGDLGVISILEALQLFAPKS